MLLQIVEDRFILHQVEESGGSTLVAGSTSSPGPVNVVNDSGGRVVVDDVSDVIDVNTSCCDIGAYKDVRGTVAECVESLLSLLLRLAAVQGGTVLAKPAEVVMQTLNVVLEVDEDDDWRLWVAIEQLRQLLLPLGVLRDELNPLLDIAL